jgi:hypothetical protein
MKLLAKHEIVEVWVSDADNGHGKDHKLKEYTHAQLRYSYFVLIS